MNPTPPKRPRTRLDPYAYEQLRRPILEHDNWRCQNCGASQNLPATDNCVAPWVAIQTTT
jgi:hypothetical protein